MNTTTNENSNTPKTGLITAILVAIYAAVLLLMLSSKTLTANAKEEKYVVSYSTQYEVHYKGNTSLFRRYGSFTVESGYTLYGVIGLYSNYGFDNNNEMTFYLVNDENGLFMRYSNLSALCNERENFLSHITDAHWTIDDLNGDGSQYRFNEYEDLPTSIIVLESGDDEYTNNVYNNIAYSTNFPIFESEESLTTYLATGDDSGQVNKPKIEIPNSSINGVYDETIGHVQNLQIDTVTAPECHGASDSFLNCFVLSWDIPATNKNEYTEYYETKINMQYSYLTGLSTSRKYGSQFVDYNVNGSILCILSSEGTHAFCAHEFYEFTNLKETYSGLNYVLSFYIKDVTKIYMRPVRVSNTDSAISYGDWTVFDVDFSRGILNDRVVTGGTIYPGDSTINPDGSIDNEPSGTIEPTDTENSFSFAGIDLTDIKNIGAYFIGLLETLVNMIGYFPTLFSRVYSFLPSEIINMIYCGFVVVFVTGLFKIFT